MPKKSLLVVSFIVVLASVAVATLLGLRGERHPSSLQAEAHASAQKGWQWLSHYQGKLLDPAIPFIIRNINNRYCSSSIEGKSFWENGWDEFKTDSYLRVFERLFADAASYKISNAVVAVLDAPQLHSEYNSVLPEALYCDLHPVPSDFFQRAFGNISNASGYDLTHEFWSAALFKENGCVDGAHNVDAILSGAAHQLVEEEGASPFDDLYAERAAFLMEYGFKNLVPSEWIAAIIRNQNLSGSWGTPTFFSVDSENPHTTALAIWALTQYTGECPFSN